MNTLARKFVLFVVFLSGLAGFVSLAWAQNSIENLSASQQSGQTVVQVTFKNPLAATPGSFTVPNPARVVFDFPQTTSNLGRTSQDVGEGDLRTMNIVQAGDRARLVLNLRNAAAYASKVDGNNLIITLTQAAPRASASSVSTRFSEGQSDRSHAVRDINFRRGKNGEGRVVVDLSDTSTGVDIRQQGQSIIVDFLKTSLPDTLRKRFDVVDFATPVQTVSAFPQGDGVRLVIEPKGLWEQSAYQTDTEFVVEVKPVQYDPNKLVQGTRTGYVGEKLSLNFQNVEVRSVLNVIADFTDLNIITSDSVGGSLTLRLKDVPWDQALALILQTRGLDMRKSGNVIWIAPRDELATKEKLALEAQQQIGDLETLRTENFVLNFAKADEMQRLLVNPQNRLLSKRGSVVADTRTNQIFVQDIQVRLDDVRRLLSQLDVPTRQVLIEARIVEATDSFSKNLGARLGIHQPQGSNNAMVGGRIADTGFHSGQSATTPDFINDSLGVNMPAAGTGGFNAGVFSLILFPQDRSRFLNLEVSALESDGKGKVISSPRVLTANNVDAVIEQGTQIPYQQATSSGATSVAFANANLALKVKPQITPDGKINMLLDINNDSVGTTTAAGPSINTKHVKTQVLVENGGTVVIGGIYTQNTNQTVTKVPFFGDLPFIGAMFRNNSRSDTKTELLVFITPRIVEERVGLR